MTDNEAPFAYLKGSHNPDMKWREKKEKEYHVYGRTHGSYGHFCPAEVDYIAKKYKHEKIVCHAKAGTVIIVDTRGLHRGTVLRANHRLVLANFFGVRD